MIAAAKNFLSAPAVKAAAEKTNSATTNAQAELEERLQAAVKTRETTEIHVKSNVDQLEKMFGKKGPVRPRSSAEQIDEQIAKLELERTINSMSLKEEREILKKIHKLNIERRSLGEFAQYDKDIKDKKSTVTTLRASLKEQRADISEIRTELTTVNTAVELGCDVKDLVGTKMDCPADKMGKVIGKKGKNVQSLKANSHVDVDVVKTGGEIRLIGTIDSLAHAKKDLDKVIQQIEKTADVPTNLHKYLTSARITALTELRARNPDVYFNIARGQEEVVRIRGLEVDIQFFEADLLGLEIVQASLKLTNREAGIIVGKGGTTIAGLVERHQAAIEVQRKSKEESDTEDQGLTNVTFIGPAKSVQASKAEVEEMLAANKDHEKSVSVDRNARSALLLNNGSGIQSLHKKVNEATRTAMSDKDAVSSGPPGNISYVSINFGDDHVLMKGKSKALEYAIPIVEREIKQIEAMMKRVVVDPVAVPVIIGKGGKGLKELKGSTTTVNLEIDRAIGEVTICGLDKDEVQQVTDAVEAVKAANFVQRVQLECGETELDNFSAQFKNFLRSPALKEIRELVFMVADDEKKDIVLRGTPENVAEAKSILADHLLKSYTEELVVTDESLSALLTGGKSSKIVEFAATGGINLSTDRERNAIIARGEKAKVHETLNAVRAFLFGNDEIAVKHITLTSSDLMGIVIGKGGKTKADLQAKYSSVAIGIHRTAASITLRGEKEEVKMCHVEIMKLVLSASISVTTDLSEKHFAELSKSKFNRRVSQLVPVQAILSAEKSSILFKGTPSDVKEAVALLKLETTGVYESRLNIDSTLFPKVLDACKNRSHMDRIKRETKADVVLDEKSNEIVLEGKRANVKEAKDALVVFLDFILGASMSKCPIPDHTLSMTGKPAFLADAAANSGAHIILDRDLSSFLIFSVEADNVVTAFDLLSAKIAESQQLVCLIQLDEADDWLLSAIIGKSGATIKKLRKQCGCTIDVESKKRQVLISANTPELVAQAKDILDSFILTARNECVFIQIPAKEMPAFVGRAGANIKEFSGMHEVEVQVLKNQAGSVRITGNAENVAAARTAAEDWLVTRAEAKKESEAQQTKQLRPNQVGAVIGPKGSVIRSLEKEFGCKIDVDRQSSVVTVKGGSEDKRNALLGRIEEILTVDREVTEPTDEASTILGSPTSESVDENRSDKKTNQSKLSGDKAGKNKAPKKSNVQAVSTKGAPKGSEFPALGQHGVFEEKTGASNNEAVPNVPTTNKKLWAAMVLASDSDTKSEKVTTDEPTADVNSSESFLEQME